MNSIFSVGTQVIVYGKDHGVVIGRNDQLYHVRLIDGSEVWVKQQNVRTRKGQQLEGLQRETITFNDIEKYRIYSCITGSSSYGLAIEGSDTDVRGIYCAPANIEWGLFGYPETLERRQPDETYFEIKKFLILALKANPNILEMLYTPDVTFSTPISDELLDNRKKFLSETVYHTYNGYAQSQFSKLEQDIRNRNTIRWKHASHLCRLLIAGAHMFNEGDILVDVGEHRDMLVEIKLGHIPWDYVDNLRLDLHKKLEDAFFENKAQIPKKPDFDWANNFLIHTRRSNV